MVEQKIRLAQLRLCFDTTPQAQVATVVNGTLLAIFLREVVPATTLATWFGAMLLLSGVRVLVWRRFVRLDDPGHALDRWDRLNLAGAVASGVLWGSASLMMFPASSIGHQVFLSFVLGGMAAGAVTTLSSRLSAAIAFIVLALMPLVFRFAFATHEFAAGMSFMLSLFMIMMMVAAARFSHNFARTQSESLRREEAELELAKIEYYDPLTGLPNRNLFNDHLERAIASASRHDHRIAVCYIDLDYFRELNEAHGRDVGDRLIISAGRALEKTLRAGDVVARWGGDEFAVLLNHVAGADALDRPLERLVAVLAGPHVVDDVSHEFSASIGAALAPPGDADPELMLREATHAMHLAKQAGRRCYHVFDAARDMQQTAASAARDSIAAALLGDELELYLQPKVDMRTGTVVGAEALLRWAHPQQGLLAPGEFLPMWETDEAMADVDRWVLENAVREAAAWQRQGHPMAISVNVSAWLLHDDGFGDMLAELLERHRNVRGLVELEVTETRALDDINRISELMARSAELDVRFALDDFGTGFSSLVHLQRLPAQTLKIDTSFVRSMLDNENDRNLVRGIVSLAQALDKEVVAEGVESAAHGRALLEFGCRLAQGYGIARPMPAAEFPAWVERHEGAAAWGVGSPLSPGGVMRGAI